MDGIQSYREGMHQPRKDEENQELGGEDRKSMSEGIVNVEC